MAIYGVLEVGVFGILVLWEVGFGSIKRDTLLNERTW